MGVFSLVEDRPTPKNVYNWRVYICAAVVASAAIMIGYDSAFIGGTLALTSFKNEFNWSQYSQEQSDLISANIVSCYQAGAFFGAFAAYPAGYFIGRKRGLQLMALVFNIGAAMMLGTTSQRGFGLLYGGRVLAGFGIGGASNLAPIYISEVAPPAIRGGLVGLYELGWQIGGLCGFWINYGVNQTMAPSHQQWLIPFGVQLVPAGLLFIGLFFVKESPRWLFSIGKNEQARRNLCWLRKLPADDVYMIEEVDMIESALAHQRSAFGSGFWVPFRVLATNRKVMYRFLLGGSLFFWQNTSGINAINYYSPTIFKSIGIMGTSTSLLTTGIFGVIKTLATLFWLFFLVDRVGRRNVLFVGAVGGAFCLYYVGAYIKIANPAQYAKTGGPLTSGGISAMAFFYLWTIFYSPTWNGTPWVYNSEMFDQNVRTLAQAFAAANNWLWNFLVARFTPQMFTAMGYGVYFFFASLMLCSCVFVWFCLPETKGVPLEAMDRLFDRSIPARKAHKIVIAELKQTDLEFRHDAVGAGLQAEKDSSEIQHERHEFVNKV